MNNKCILIFSVLVLCFSSLGTIAEASEQECNAFTGGTPSPASVDFDKRVKSSWCSSRKSPTEHGTLISFSVGDDGKIHKPSIRYSSSDPQFDAECLEAICSLSPLASSKISTGTVQHFSIQLGDKNAVMSIQPAFTGPEILKLASDLKLKTTDAFVIIHKIPLSVLEKYPGMFSSKDLQNSENLIALRLDKKSKPPEFQKRISDFYSDWAILFATKNVTKEQIVEHAKTISSDVGI